MVLTAPRRDLPFAAALATQRGAPLLDMVVPVFNEQADLAASVQRLHAHLTEQFPFTWRITIADNASTDDTPLVAAALAASLPGVRVVRLERKGRGHTLAQVWAASDAAVLAYTDVDLSTDLAALAPLVAPLISGHSDLAIGSRLGHSSQVVRGAKREFISRCYNLLLRSTLSARFSDAQCGFKAVRADVAARLLPHVRDSGWFFDTELLVLAERSGLRIHEVPVDWVDDPDSSVDIVATAWADLRGVARLARGLATGTLPVAAIAAQLRPTTHPAPQPSLLRRGVRFAAVGVVSTLAYLLLFVLLRDPLGAHGANFAALASTAVANTAANRRVTFGVRGRAGALRHHVEGLAVFTGCLALTSGALAVLPLLGDPPRWTEPVALVVANLVGTGLRFVALRGWVFHPRRRADPAPGRPRRGGRR